MTIWMKKSRQKGHYGGDKSSFFTRITHQLTRLQLQQPNYTKSYFHISPTHSIWQLPTMLCLKTWRNDLHEKLITNDDVISETIAYFNSLNKIYYEERKNTVILILTDLLKNPIVALWRPKKNQLPDCFLAAYSSLSEIKETTI